MTSIVHFVMPADGLHPSRVEELFLPQAQLLQQHGFQVSIVRDSVFQDAVPIRAIPAGATVIYRGWMVRSAEYERFECSVRNSGAVPLTDTRQYLLIHHLPNWYPALIEFTPESIFITSADDLIPKLRSLGWGRYFLKDFVKSLKVDGGSIVSSPDDAERWLREMLQYRDDLEGGVCIRQVEEFIPDSECRFFVLHRVPYAPDNRQIPAPVLAAADRIASAFFTVDVAQNTAGEWRIVELGDGQVSDLVGWTPERFAEMW